MSNSESAITNKQPSSNAMPSQKATERLAAIKAKYPEVASAVMPALYLAQEELGSITEGAVAWVAQQLGITAIRVMEVASFYTMYYKHAVGKYHVQVCRTLSCYARGAGELTKMLEKKFGVKAHEVTPDGMFSFEEVECLGSCGTAPMCQVNDRFFENLTVESLDRILEEIRKEQPNLKLSTISDTLGDGLKNHPVSQIISE